MLAHLKLFFSPMIWYASIVHFWWGALFVLFGDYPKNFGGVAFFMDSGIPAPAWGFALCIMAVLGVLGAHIRWRPIAGFLLAVPQQITITLGSIHAATVHLPSGDPIPLYAAAYVLPLAVCHFAAMVVVHATHMAERG